MLPRRVAVIAEAVNAVARGCLCEAVSAALCAPTATGTRLRNEAVAVAVTVRATATPPLLVLLQCARPRATYCAAVSAPCAAVAAARGGGVVHGCRSSCRHRAAAAVAAARPAYFST